MLQRVFFFFSLFSFFTLNASFLPDHNAKTTDDLLSIWITYEGKLYSVQTAISTDNGNSWSQPTNLFTNNLCIKNAQVALSNTNAIAIWENDENFQTDAFTCFSIDGGKKWSLPNNLSHVKISQYITSPQVSLFNKKAIAMWIKTDGQNSCIECAYTADVGNTWSLPIPISSTGMIENPCLTLNELNSIALWKKYDLSYWVIQSSYSYNGGKTWFLPVTLSLENLNSSEPFLAQVENRALAIWLSSYESKNSVEISLTTDGGMHWKTPIHLSNVDEDASSPHVAISKESAIAIWSSCSEGSKNQCIRTCRSLDGGLSWKDPITIATNFSVTNPQIALNGKKGIAIWVATKNTSQIIQVSTTNDGGATWSYPVNFYEVSSECRSFQIAFDWDGSEKFQFTPFLMDIK